MHSISRKSSSGFALLIFVLMLMGIGGIALTGFTQKALDSVEQQRFEQNREVLQQAKDALLMYAFNYPVISSIGGNPPIGPGRLPCPYDQVNGYSGPLSNAICGSVGRLPWQNNLNIPRLQDASGEDLWYAVSSNFYNPVWGPARVNSDSLGTITVFDQAGGKIYDGTVSGIAAIIIAPGTPIRRDEDGDGIYEYAQVRNSALQQVSPNNYLDTINDFDNSVFVNGSNANADGFTPGPIFDPNYNDIVINDQVMIITADEVIAMAEKATLQAYRDAIAEYRNNIGVDTYPWLDNYNTTDLDQYDADINTRIGRVPSIFADYFNDNTVASEGVISDLRLFNQDFAPTGYPPGVLGVSIPATNVMFDGAGNLSADFSRSNYYFWDEDVGPNGWEICPFSTNSSRDCHQSSPGVFVGNPAVDPNLVPMKVLRVNIGGAIPGTKTFNFNYAPATSIGPTYSQPSATSHAEISYRFLGSSIGTIGGINVQYDGSYSTGPFSPTAPEIFWVAGEVMHFGIRYYPVLPEWALAVNDDWHNTIQMAYSAASQPGAAAPCTAGVDCLIVNNSGGVVNDKNAILTIASDHDLDDGAGDGFTNDLIDIFDNPEHTDLDDTYDARIATGNDTVFIMDNSL